MGLQSNIQLGGHDGNGQVPFKALAKSIADFEILTDLN
jgi:hypothetical protein